MLNPVEYGYDARQPLQGIIAHLTQACGGNVHEQDVVKATASSFIAGWEPQNAVDLGTISNFCSRNARESWISYDFRARRVLPTSYTIRSCGAGAGGCHPRSWVFEGSMDGKEWFVVDSRENSRDLNGS